MQVHEASEGAACPKCGFAPDQQSDVECGAGELVQVKRKMPMTKDTKQHVYSQLLFVAQKRGYSRGWVSHKYRAMFDVWPRGMSDVPATPSDHLLNWLKSQAIRHAKGREKAEAHHAA